MKNSDQGPWWKRFKSLEEASFGCSFPELCHDFKNHEEHLAALLYNKAKYLSQMNPEQIQFFDDEIKIVRMKIDGKYDDYIRQVNHEAAVRAHALIEDLKSKGKWPENF